MFSSIVLRALCAAAFLLPFAAPVRGFAGPAATPSPTPSPPPEIGHVSTSDRSVESAARASRTTYVVSAAQIARDGDRTVADVLENVPGVDVLRYGGFGAATTVGIRGSSAQQVLVLMDGLPVAGAQIDNVDLEQLSVAGIDRIEVVEGGGSTLYGSGSIGGVINIITAARPQQSSATVSTGSFGEQTYQLQTPYVTFSRTYAANDYPVENGPNRQNAQAGLTTGNARYAHRVGVFLLTLSGDIGNAAVGAPGELDYASATSEQNTVTRDLRLDVQRRGARSTVSFDAGASSQDLAYTCDTPVDGHCPNSSYPTPAPGTTSNPPYAQLLDDRHWMATLRDVVGDDRQRLVYGIDLMRGVARVDQGTGGGSPYAADNGEIFDTYAQTAAYLQSQWFLPSGNEIYAGLRGERDGAVGGEYSPSLGGIVRISNDVELKVNASTAFRSPTAEDLYYPFFSNPNLQPERTRVADVTLVVPALLGGASVAWFTTSGSNLIVSPPPLYVPENVGHALIQGFTLDVKTRPFHGYAATLTATNLYRAQDLDANVRLAGRGPVFAITTGLEWLPPSSGRFDGFAVTARTQGPQAPPDPYLSPAFATYQPAAFTVVDARLGYRVTPNLVLSLRGFNLGNDRYAVYAGYPVPGRSFVIELRARQPSR